MSEWTASTDFRASPGQQNPAPDAYGHSSVWHYRQSATLVRDPAQYSLFEGFDGAYCSISGAERWLPGGSNPNAGANTPFVGKNTTADTMNNICGSTGAWGNEQLTVHPSESRLAVVEWHSPISGTVRIDGYITDMDPGCEGFGADGVGWAIDKAPADRSSKTTIAFGSVANGFAVSQNFGDGTVNQSLEAVAVTAGDIVYLAIDPGGGFPSNENCDTTGLEFVLQEVGGGGGAAAEAHITTPPDNAVYDLGQQVRVASSCSGTYATCTATDRLGEIGPNDLLDTNQPGTFNFTVRARDSQGAVLDEAVHKYTIRPAAPSLPGGARLRWADPSRSLIAVYPRGGWVPADGVTVTYAWLRCDDRTTPTNCRPIAGANGATLALPAERRAYRVQGVIIGTNEAGSRAAISPVSRTIRRPPRAPYIASGDNPPSVNGDRTVGEVLHASPGDWSGTPKIAFRYRWQVCSFEVLCTDINTRDARGPDYKVRPEDFGQKLRVEVTGVNEAGERAYWSSTTSWVQADRRGRREALVRESYLIAFGRLPTAGETDYWRDRNETLAELIDKHRGYLRRNDAAAKAVTTAAYEKVYGHGANVHQGEQYADDWKSRTIYDELVDRLARRLARQAYERIFFWNTKLRKHGVDWVVDLVRSGYFGNHRSYYAGERLWTEVALSNEELHGAAHTSYDTGASGAKKHEACFGGVGPGCSGASIASAAGTIDRTKTFVTEDGRRMTYVHLNTVVGSILHDAICRSFPTDGAWCYGPLPGIIDDFRVDHWNVPASWEWNKAFTNTFGRKGWMEWYGPYPLHEAEGLIRSGTYEGKYSDDIRPAAQQRRYTEVYNGQTMVAWGNVEMRASLRLRAPGGTNLDHSDKDFCAARSWSSVGAGTCGTAPLIIGVGP